VEHDGQQERGGIGMRPSDNRVIPAGPWHSQTREARDTAGRAVQAGDGRNRMPTVSQKQGSDEAEEDEKSATMARLATGAGGGATSLSEQSS
jgi:hypothetical protein